MDQTTVHSQVQDDEHIKYWMPQINELSAQLRFFDEKFIAALSVTRESTRSINELETMSSNTNLPVECLLHHAYAVRDCLELAMTQWEQVVKDLLTYKNTGR